MTDDLSDAQIVDTITNAVGFRPLDALVVLPFCEHDEAPLVVADVPPNATNKAILRRFSSAVSYAATRMACAHSAIVVLYTSAEYGDPGTPTGYPFVWEVCKKLHRAGLHPVGLFCVAVDGWGEYSLKGETGPRFERRQLDDLSPVPVREL